MSSAALEEEAARLQALLPDPGAGIDPEAARANLEPDDVEVLLSHNAGGGPHLAREGCAAILSGHSHGGQIDLPILRGIGPPHPGVRVPLGPTVLIVSRGLSNSGVIELLARYFIDVGRKLAAHIGIMSGLAASLSAVMNNVAALALLMPLDLQAAKKSGRSPSLSLMPLSFASILGGMITLIGTPPNIVIAEYRADALGEPFRMFDFTPVGLACAVAG